MSDAYATYSYLVQITTNDNDIVSNFGYRVEEAFHEQIRSRVMRALAEHPHLIAIEMSSINLSNLEAALVGNEEEIEEEDDI